MAYEFQLARDRASLRTLARSELTRMHDQLGPTIAPDINKHVDTKLGEFSLLGSTFYDIAHHGTNDPKCEKRQKAALNSGLMMSTLEMMDNIVDHSRTTDLAAIDTFYGNCFETLATDSDRPIVQAMAWPNQQFACYALAHYTHKNLEAYRDERSPLLLKAVSKLQAVALEQFTAEDPEVLLRLVEDIHGQCTEFTTMACEFADDTSYPEMRRAAWHFGALGGALDNGSEIAEDLAEGSNTYATALIKQQGVSSATLRNIADWRKESVYDHYTRGLDVLESPQQRAIYRSAVRGLKMRYALKRLRGSNSLSTLEAIFNSGNQSHAEDNEPSDTKYEDYNA